MAAPSNRQRTKQAKSAAKLLDPSTTHIDYITARGHPRLGTMALVVGGVVVTVFLVALAMGFVIFPGFIALIAIYYGVFPPRAVVVADQGVAVLHRSILNNQPNRVIALLTHDQMAQVQAVAKGSKAEMPFGPERLTFTKKEWARFTAAVAQVGGQWTGAVHLHAAGDQLGGAPNGPGPLNRPGADQPSYSGLPPIPGVDTPRPDVGPGAADGQPSYSGLPPIPGVDTPRPDVGPGATDDPGRDVTEF